MRTAVIWTMVLLGGYTLGALSHKYRFPPIPWFQEGKRLVWATTGWGDPTWLTGYKNVGDRVAADCQQFTQRDTAVLLTFGQSNAANYGSLGFVPVRGVYNFSIFDGRCYEAKDPLLGATGDRGSVWTRVGSKIIERGRARRVLIVPIAVGSTSVRFWRTGQVGFSRIETAVSRLAGLTLAPTHWLWHQGETDAGVLRRGDYKEAFWDMEQGIRALGMVGPLFVSVASVCLDRGSEAIRQAQRELAHSRPGLFAGPDTDDLVHVWERRDGCHFSEEGLDIHADRWVEALLTSGAL